MQDEQVLFGAIQCEGDGVVHQVTQVHRRIGDALRLHLLAQRIRPCGHSTEGIHGYTMEIRLLGHPCTEAVCFLLVR